MDIKVLVIINPASGKGNILEKTEEIKQNLIKQNMEPDIYFTKKEENAKKIIEEHKEDKDLILICGGDGTLNEAVEAIMEDEELQNISVSFIPLGTTNDFARSLNIPIKDISITSKLLETKAKRVDIGKFNESKSFCYVAAFGLITDVPYTTNIEKKHKYGKWAYYLEALKRLKKIPTYRIKLRYDGKHIEDDFIYGGITNSESIGGFKWFEKGEILLDDGEFEGIFIRKPKNIFGYIKILSSFLRKEYSENEYIFSTRAKEYEIQSEENLSWTIDGEFAGSFNNVIINNQKRAIEFAVYEEEENRK